MFFVRIHCSQTYGQKGRWLGTDIFPVYLYKVNEGPLVSPLMKGTSKDEGVIAFEVESFSNVGAVDDFCVVAMTTDNASHVLGDFARVAFGCSVDDENVCHVFMVRIKEGSNQPALLCPKKVGRQARLASGVPSVDYELGTSNELGFIGC